MPKIRKNAGYGVDKNLAFVYYCTPKEDGRLKTYPDVAEHFHVNVRRVEDWGATLQWVNRRDDIGRNSSIRFTEKQADLNNKLNDRLFTVWTKALHLLESEIDTIDFAQRITLLREFSDLKKNLDKSILKKLVAPSARDFRDLYEALERATNRLRVLTNQPTEVSKSDITTHEGETAIPTEEAEKIDNYIGELNKNANVQQTETTPSETN